ncbi:MAG: (deoxy)nucleoside triphosphate pyrophosphohydrolase [Candidatus Aminicenantales bacterium]
MPRRSISAEPRPLRVLAAVLEKDGRWLIAKRKKGDCFSGLWEFPGGKLESGETPRECLARELHEEFGIQAHVGRFLARVHYTSPAFSIDLAAYAVSHLSGALRLHDHEEIRWVRPGRAGRYPLTEPDKLLLAELKALAVQGKP